MFESILSAAEHGLLGIACGSFFASRKLISYLIPAIIWATTAVPKLIDAGIPKELGRTATL